MRVLPDLTTAQVEQLDVLLIPGGQGTRREAKNEALLDWIAPIAARCRMGHQRLHRSAAADGGRIRPRANASPPIGASSSSCGRAERRPRCWNAVRYVRDGNVVTAAGVSAGIDMALWLVGQMHGRELARFVQRAMEYDPAPPYAAEV